MDAERSAIVRFSGDLDYTRHQEVFGALNSMNGAAIAILDLSDVYYVDSTFLKEIARLYQRMSTSGTPFSIRIVGACEHLRRIFNITNLDSIAQFYDTKEEAGAAQP